MNVNVLMNIWDLRVSLTVQKCVLDMVIALMELDVFVMMIIVEKTVQFKDAHSIAMIS
jgi:hypothetical protein